jgi:hypothetical protein
MGSPLLDEEIESRINHRTQWHNDVIALWYENSLTFEDAMSEEWIKRAFDLRSDLDRFLATIEGLEELYLMKYLDLHPPN